ncbi:sigma-54 dependent transcriptional regulator [Anaeromyxobacter sp. PSR-1]|uniref:sigma-54-dependent transcriptional regulator n=1 Tax=unclassified Anaeromyxobacter TaxID=2620896 RepID=UPI0005E84BB8|nr:sigma-54 dependent transcriptional regulator [Anaeromyxobacter sp. PSR-1]GAO02407.1 acetoacetate metabolism regulatory protein AtoC [Anaeromyxobacter sp. PSR-1]
MSRLLLVDDEPAVLYALKELARSNGHEPVTARSGAEALERLEGVDAVVTDYAMPEMDGLQLLQAIHERDATLPVVVLTAQGSERVAVRAMKAGAYEYVTKPFDIDEMTLVLDRALETRALRVQNRRLAVEKALGRSIVGDAPAMQRLLDAVARVAPKDVTVLVRGETGTGKELIASLLHAQSRRASGPLVRFNCAAIPAELAEAELFGHARGAFTGAVQAREGFFAQADGGTLVLDEVGELPLPLQAKLLRALQEGEIQPVGAGRVERVDVRVVAATHRDLAEEARAGRFREDLYYRLAVVELVVPPLREHREDIPALAKEFARRFAARFGVDDVRLSPPLLERLAAAEWPGNVRQLENQVARLVALSNGGELGPEALEAGAAPAAREPGVEPPPEGALTLHEHLDAVERNIIARTLAATGGNQSETARRLGVSRGALIDRLKKYGFA